MIQLSSRQFLIIRLLQKNNIPMPGNTLAKLLDISPRTLRYDISQINTNANDFHITSSKEGYALTMVSEDANILLNDIQISEQPKSTNIVLQYLLNHDETNLYDIANECFISESGIVRCMNSIKPLLDKYHLSIMRKSDNFSIIGSEYDKRDLFAHLIHHDATNHFTDLNQLKDYFRGFNIEDIQRTVDEVLKKHLIKVDDVHYKNLLMNLAISLQRILLGYAIEPLPFTYTINKEDEIYIVANEICSELEHKFSVCFAETDYEYVQILCIGSIKPNSNNEEDNILYKDYSFVYKVKEILDNTVTNYALPLDYNLLLNNFTLHIHRLFFRSKASLYFQNDFSDNLKHTHPFIYELAVYIAYQIKETFHVEINDSEIGLFAIYLGLMIGGDAEEKNPFKVICICPEYNDLRKHFSNQLMIHFSDTIQLKEFVSSIREIKNKEYDFIISTINDYENELCINVSPLLLKQDLDKLNLKLELMKEKRKKEILKRELAKYIDKKLFFRNHDFDCKKDAILFLCSQMLKYGDAKTDFVDSVFDREKVSSTAFFNKFAVPHAIRFTNVKTRITFLINEKPIPWNDDSLVNLVMLISINEKDIMTFNNIYSSIIDLLLDDKSFARVLEIKTFEELSLYLESHV